MDYFDSIPAEDSILLKRKMFFDDNRAICYKKPKNRMMKGKRITKLNREGIDDRICGLSYGGNCS